MGYYKPNTDLDRIKDIDVKTKWLPFCRRHLQIVFFFTKNAVYWCKLHWSLFQMGKLTIVQRFSFLIQGNAFENIICKLSGFLYSTTNEIDENRNVISKNVWNVCRFWIQICWMLWSSHKMCTLKTKNCHNTKFVSTVSTVGIMIILGLYCTHIVRTS